jgi:predicted alpha-1,6-mannanase (GH76 family)
MLFGRKRARDGWCRISVSVPLLFLRAFYESVCFKIHSPINKWLASPHEARCNLQILDSLPFTMLSSSFKSLLFLATAARAGYSDNAAAALDTLQKWYNTDSGVWDTTGWWNSGNCLTVVADLAAVDPSTADTATEVFANSLALAKAPSPETYSRVKRGSMAQPSHRPFWPRAISNTALNSTNFLNDYYDDEGWWALGWIQAYDVTNNEDYLTTAVDIFNDMSGGNTTNCGGIWWDKYHTAVNAIANELYISVAAHLANRESDKQLYLDIAQQQWAWFQGTGMINDDNLINDGLDENCENNGETVWSYNQGVILGALVELEKATQDNEYITVAKDIASAAIDALSNDHGVLTDSCEPDCGDDGPQFKGIFMRNLQKLHEASPEDQFLSFINTNADSIWDQDRGSDDELTLLWSGPFMSPANASTHSSAMDAIVAAVAFESS